MADEEGLALATVDDLEARWRPLEAAERSRADVTLLDASLMLRALMGARLDPSDAAQAALLRAVACAATRRALEDASAREGTGLPPASQASMTAGSYQQSWTAANPNGDVFFTRSEKRALGIGGSALAYIPPHVGRGRPCSGE